MTSSVAYAHFELDRTTRRLRPDLLFGGHPRRFLRLSGAGVAALDELMGEQGETLSDRARTLGRRLVAAGLAHAEPVPSALIDGVTIVIPVKDRSAGVDRLLHSLNASEPDVPVIVVDDGSGKTEADNLSAMARRHGTVTVVTRPASGGPSAARNTGLCEASTPYILFLDSDCEVPHSTGWLARLLRHLTVLDPQPSDHKSLAAVAPRIVGRGQRTSAQRYASSFCPLDMGPNPSLVAPGRAVPYVPTAALLVRTAALADLGDGAVFDPALRYGEDVDLVWRLGDGRVRYDPSVEIVHHELDTWPALLARRFRYGRSAADLDQRHPGTVDPLRLLMMPTATAVAFLAGRPASALALYGVMVTSLRAQLRRSDLPTDGTAKAVAEGVVQTGLGLSRYLNQFWTPLVALITLTPFGGFSAATRWRLAATIAARPVIEAVKRPGTVSQKATATVVHMVEEAAYGVGVWRGAVALRRWSVLTPRLDPSSLGVPRTIARLLSPKSDCGWVDETL